MAENPTRPAYNSCVNDPGLNNPAPSQPHRSLAGTVLGRYRLAYLIGEGGMGVVYEARHLDLGRSAAVKILNERFGQSASVRARFLREGQAAARIRHPNIVDVYDVGVQGDRAYLVMELLEGENLRSLLARERRLSAQHTADLLLPVISALAAAHDAGVIHRDLKPDNVFLAQERHTLIPKVVDFGISKFADSGASGQTTTGVLLGTPYYLSPEHARKASSIDGRSDQYACGVILYECVTGRRPLEEPAIYPLLQRIIHGDFAPPRQINPALPAALEVVILKAMARDPSQRFPTTRALGRALLEFASERARDDYAEEFAGNGVTVRPLSAGSPVRTALELGTTLRASAHEHYALRPVTRGKVRTLPVLGTLLLIFGLLAAVGWRLSQRAATEPSPGVASSGVAAKALSSAPAAAAMEELPPAEVVRATGKLNGLDPERVMARARAAGFTIQLLQDYSAGNLSQVHFYARRENDTATVALLQYSDLYQSAKETSANQHVDALKSTRGAHVAVDGGTVFYVVGSPVNSVGAPSSPSIRKALFDAVVR